MIAVDLSSAAEALEAGRLLDATTLAARALLVTRGEQADGALQSLELFFKHFAQTNAIAAELHPLIQRAIQATAASAQGLEAPAAEVAALLAAVRALYEGMGPSLRVSAN